MLKCTALLLCFAINVTIAAIPLSAEVIRLPATKDNSIVMVDGEWNQNAGEQGRIRIKGNQHIVALDFDVSSIRGKMVTRAALVCQAAAEDIRGVTISTIATPWDETKSSALDSGMNPGVPGWGYADARFPSVCGGNAFTLVHNVVSPRGDDNKLVAEYRWELSPDLLHAMATEVAYGLAIHEHDADYGRNPTIFSREQSGKQPYLEVEVRNSQDETPLPATEVQLIPVDETAATLTFRGPEFGFAYRVSINGHPLGRHNVPLVAPGELQTITLRDLPPEVTKAAEHQVAIVTCNRTGQISASATATGKLFDPRPISWPTLPKLPRPNPATDLTNLSIIPVVDKYDLSGLPIGELPDDYRTFNRVFRDKTITLTAVAGEVVSFQALVRGDRQATMALTMDRDASWRTDLYTAVYVDSQGQRIPDPLLPMPQSVWLSPHQDTSIVADIYVPFEAEAGIYRGSFSVSDGPTVPIQVTVLPVAIPRRATFLCEMNSYGLPDHVDEFYALQQAAYDHRVHINILHYSHHTAAPGARKSNLDMRLKSGRRMDNRRYDNIEPGAKQAYWDDFAEAFGPYLDGSCFRDGHRGPVPAPGFYLTFHESWPLNCRAHFNGNPDAYQAFADSPLYAETFENILSDFAKVAAERGWTETSFQVYFNNKGSLHEETKAPWILDEPASYWDYRALQFYGELTDRAARGSRTHIDYRIDISRPEYCRGQLDRRTGLWVVSGAAFQQYRRLVTDRIERDGLKVWVYGTANLVEQSNRQAIAWALDAWQHGATGLVPWQTIDKTGEALQQADQLGLFILDQDDQGQTVIRQSLRLKTFREAQQLIERLTLIQQRQGWTRNQMSQFIMHHVSLANTVQLRDADDAGTGQFNSKELLNLDPLWRATETMLE